MQHSIFTVYDDKAKAYLPPFFMHRAAMAIRTFTDACNDESHQFGKNPADYTLFEIGVYDDETATIKNHNSLKNLANGLELKGK